MVDLDSPELACLGWILSAAERERAARYRVPGLAQRYLAAHVSLRAVLAEVTGVCPAHLSFRIGRHGKPSLDDGPFFSLAHSGNIAVIAVDNDAPIGVDVERVGRRLKARWFEPWLSPNEAVGASRCGSELLLSIWARKEAAAKAIGFGLALAVDVEVSTAPLNWYEWQRVRLGGAHGPEVCSTLDLWLGARFVAAVARASSRPTSVSVHSFGPSFLSSWRLT